MDELKFGDTVYGGEYGVSENVEGGRGRRGFERANAADGSTRTHS